MCDLGVLVLDCVALGGLSVERGVRAIGGEVAMGPMTCVGGAGLVVCCEIPVVGFSRLDPN